MTLAGGTGIFKIAMKPGNIVELIDRQKIVCAVVMEIKDKRVALLTEANQETVVSSGRLSHISRAWLDTSAGRNQTVAALKEMARQRNDRANKVNIKELWEVLHSEREWIDLKTMTGLCFPDRPTADDEAGVFRAFFKDRQYFKFNADRFFPWSEAEMERMAADARKNAKKEKFLQKSADRLLEIKNQADPKPTDEDKKLIDALQSFYLFGKESPHHQTVGLIIKKTDANPEAVFDALVKLGVWDKNENMELLRHGISAAFSDDVEKHAAKLAALKPDFNASGSDRRDLTEISTMTIDGETTRDYDDALSIEIEKDGFRLGIHIMDVAHFIRKDDVIDREAVARASSIYTPDQTISMLPRILAEDVCSLKQGELRPAISVMADFDKKYEMRGHEIFPSLIRVDDRLTYDDADRMSKTRPDIRALCEIAKKFRKKRLADGAVQINLPNINIQVSPDEKIIIKKEDRDSPSHMFVAEIMIMANWLTASFLKQHDVPAVFRSQPGPRERLYQGEDESLFQNWMQRKRLSRFVLGTGPKRHGGLGLDAYVTATSPIRKYYDLITQRQVRSIFGMETPCSRPEVKQVMTRLELPMSNVSMIQFKRNRHWLLKRLEEQKDQPQEAMVLFKRGDKYQVLIPEYMMECSIPSYGGVKLRPMDIIRLTIQHVNPKKDIFSVYMR